MHFLETEFNSLQNVVLSGNIGIVLLNMGGPKSLEDVKPFLYNLFADPDIINLPRFLKPFQKQLAWLIAKLRTPGTVEMYEKIGNGSPILRITEDLGTEIKDNLRREGLDITMTIAMRYTYPRAVDAVKELLYKNIDQLILFSQYPHYSDSTSGSSFREFYSVMDEMNFKPKSVLEIAKWGEEPEYIHWWVDGVKQVINNHKIELNKSVNLIFSAHGLPKRYINAGEVYDERIKNASSLILKKLGDITDKITSHVSFQSQVGPIEWTKPYTDELLKEIGEKENQIVIIVPLGFVSNHVETLYEIDILYKKEAEGSGIVEYYRVEVPDADKDYARSIATMIERKVEEQ